MAGGQGVSGYARREAVSGVQTLTFHGYPPDRYARLKDALAAKGLHLDGDSGTVKEFGADVDYGYAAGTLTLWVRSAPHFHSMDGFCQQLTDAIAAQQ